MKNLISPTHLLYQDPLTPYCEKYQDIYFSSQNGIEESKHVYLEGSGFYASLAKKETTRVGEIGFGVGLNFLLSLQAFQVHAHPEKKLTYLAFEKNPVFGEDLKTLYSRFPDLTPFAGKLLDQYPLLVPGPHELSFFNGRVTLILCLGEAEGLLSQLDLKINHWYWDGFAPSKNPDAFSENLFQQVARLSAVNAIGSSFTAAGWVRRSLEALGFQVEKRSGYGKKRECIRATYQKNNPLSSFRKKSSPWFSNENLTRVKPGERIGIVGAGLAGSALGKEFCDRGHEVFMIDLHGIAKRASSNRAGLFTHQLSKVPNPISRFSQLSLAHWMRELAFLKIPCRPGVLQTGNEDRLKLHLNALITSGYPENFYEQKEDGIYFPTCGIIHPPALCESRLKGKINFISAALAHVTHLDHSLLLHGADHKIIAEVNHVIYANGADFILPKNALQHRLLSMQPLRAIRGQVIHLQPTFLSKNLSYTLLEDGYVTPLAPEITGHEYHLLGATYLAKEAKENQIEIDTELLLQDAKKKWHAFSGLTPQDEVSAQVGYRLSTPDKLPLIGPVCDPEWLKQNYLKTLKGRTRETNPPLQVSPREWLCMGLGSRGITFSSYAGSLLARLMCDETMPIEQDLWQHLHSARLLIRAIKHSENESGSS